MLEGVPTTLSPIGSNDDVSKLMLAMVRASIMCVMISPQIEGIVVYESVVFNLASVKAIVYNIVVLP
jgi:hypothetical protein